MKICLRGWAIAVNVGLFLVVALAPVIPPSIAQAFYPDVHIAIFQEALASKFSAEAQEFVAAGLEANDTLVGHAFHPEWHFDSAQDPAKLCDYWMAGMPDAAIKNGTGPAKLLEDAARSAVNLFNPNLVTGDPVVDSDYRYQALVAYGQYLHAIQDFYSHTNWIELHVAAQKSPGLAPIQSGCDAKTLQAALPNPQQDKLQSGYFTVGLADTLPDACGPGPGLPEGFQYCHGPFKIPAAFFFARESTLDPRLMLAKDVPEKYHGSETFTLAGGPPITYHVEARRLAKEATLQTFTVFHDRVVRTLGEAVKSKTIPDRDPECLFGVLVKGGDPADCPPMRELGGLYQGQTDQPGTQMKAVLWGPEGQLVIRSFSAELRLGSPGKTLASGQQQTTVIEGSLSYDVDVVTDRDVQQQIFQSTTLTSGTLTNLSEGAFGHVEFTGTVTFDDKVRDPRTHPGWIDVFHLALTPEDRLVLCRVESEDPQVAYRECVDNPLVVLQRVEEVIA